MAPASPTRALAELGSCLVLASPSGMAEDARAEWLKVAHMTLGDLPADLLADGCTEARKRCRFPSEIVPTIMAAVEQRWKWRREDAERPARMLPALPAPPVDDSPLVDPAEVRALIQSMGQ